jgi:hypothetical protein
MTARVFPCWQLTCEGCGETRPPVIGRVAEARDDATAHGWRRLPKRNPSGTLSDSDRSDVCPRCAPEWIPLPSTRGRSDLPRRPWTGLHYPPGSVAPDR